jgi:hypothetical protein
VSLEIHREVEDAHDKDAIVISDIEDAVPLAIVLKERPTSACDGSPQHRIAGDALQAFFKCQIVALGALYTEGLNRITEDSV